MSLKSRLLNILFHLLHLAIIFFLVFGWLFSQYRGSHLMLVLLTLGTWLVLGYCPLTRWHWDLRQAAGMPRPAGPYIPFFGRAADPQAG
jgi:hypothetical protein